MGWPQVQVLVLPLEMVVAGGGVVVGTGEGVVVEAKIIDNHYIKVHSSGLVAGPNPKKDSIIFYVVSSPQHYIK